MMMVFGVLDHRNEYECILVDTHMRASCTYILCNMTHLGIIPLRDFVHKIILLHTLERHFKDR